MVRSLEASRCKELKLQFAVSLNYLLGHFVQLVLETCDSFFSGWISEKPFRKFPKMWLQTYRYFLASISNRELKLIRFQETLYSENMRRKTLFSEVIQLVRRLIQTRLNISPTHGASHMINKIFAYLQTCYHLRQRFDFKHIIFISSSNFWVKSFSTVKVAPT